MPLSILPEANRTARYEAPDWARRVWEAPQRGGSPDEAGLPDAAAIKRDAELVLIAIPDAPAPATEGTCARLSAAFGYFVSCAAILYFFGHVAAAWAFGRW